MTKPIAVDDSNNPAAAQASPQMTSPDQLPDGMVWTRDAGHFTALARRIPPVTIDVSAITPAAPNPSKRIAQVVKVSKAVAAIGVSLVVGTFVAVSGAGADRPPAQADVGVGETPSN